MNTDLWQELLALIDHHEVKFEWVKGHAGHTENEIVDRLAVEATESKNLFEDL